MFSEFIEGLPAAVAQWSHELSPVTKLDLSPAVVLPLGVLLMLVVVPIIRHWLGTKKAR